MYYIKQRMDRAHAIKETAPNKIGDLDVCVRTVLMPDSPEPG